MFEKFLNKKEITENLTDYTFFQPVSNREYWEKLKKNGEKEILEIADYYDNYTFEVLPASLYREFFKNGNRANFEKKYFERRSALIAYTFLEAFYNDGRYLERVVDVLWMILEETDWSLPAHISLRTKESLTYYKDPVLDLFAAESSATLAFTYAVLKDKIDAVSRNITVRIEGEIYDRIIKNYLENNDYWYMGYNGKKVNNWNPWINSNVLLSALVFGQNNETKVNVIYKVMETLEKYFDNYPFDGACDEGPSYWFHAGLSALECIELLSCATNGKINIFNEEKIKNMAEYIFKAYIYNNRVVNFADASAFLKVSYGPLYKFGKILNNSDLISFSKYCYDLQQKADIVTRISAPERLCSKYEYYEEIQNLQIENKFIKEAYLPSINFLVVRECETSEKGLYLAAKGGHNEESHNHNDVGNFIIYKDGEPFFVDSGNMVYSALTFNKDTRYTLWTNISEFHNLPQINGKNQYQGMEFASSDVVYETDEEKTVFSLDIKNAYENRNEINKWVRTICFDKTNHKIDVTEDYSLSKTESVTLNFLTHKPMVISEMGFLMTAENGAELKMNIDISLFEIERETIEFDDRILNASWGKQLYRTKLKLKDVKSENKIKYTII